MTAPSIVRPRHFILAAIVLIGSFLAAPAARADQTSATISVSATVQNVLTLTITDPTAEFGTNLSGMGQATNSLDTVWNTMPQNGRVFYRWRPTLHGLPSTFASVTSSVPFDVTLTAQENTGTSPDLRVSQGDLRAGVIGLQCDQPLTNAQVESGPLDFASHPAVLLFDPGIGGTNVPIVGCLFLDVRASDRAGTFESTITVTLSN